MVLLLDLSFDFVGLQAVHDLEICLFSNSIGTQVYLFIIFILQRGLAKHKSQDWEMRVLLGHETVSISQVATGAGADPVAPYTSRLGVTAQEDATVAASMYM